MNGIKTYKELVAWEKAMDLVQMIYCTTGTFPRDERYGLTAQLRRAAVSIPSNLAEGQGRKSRAEFVRFISIAYGSLCEVETQLQIAIRLGFLSKLATDPLLDLASEVGRLLNGLSTSLRSPRTAA